MIEISQTWKVKFEFLTQSCVITNFLLSSGPAVMAAPTVNSSIVGSMVNVGSDVDNDDNVFEQKFFILDNSEWCRDVSSTGHFVNSPFA